ncbi:MAG: CotD family spore coat protein [Lysinibacillus sp.]
MFNRNRRQARRCRNAQCQNQCCMPPNQFNPSQMSPNQFNPNQMSPNQFDPPQISPTEQIVQTNVMRTVVPHVHPRHITTVNQHIIDHQHHFPCTESVVNECCEQNTMCGMPHNNWNGPQPRRRFF